MSITVVNLIKALLVVIAGTVISYILHRFMLSYLIGGLVGMLSVYFIMKEGEYDGWILGLYDFFVLYTSWMDRINNFSFCDSIY